MRFKRGDILKFKNGEFGGYAVVEVNSNNKEYKLRSLCSIHSHWHPFRVVEDILVLGDNEEEEIL